VPRRTTALATALAAASLSLAGAASAEAASSYPGWAPNVPWGAGCEPAPSPALRTAANCGATLVDGEAVPPPGAPPVVKRVIHAANEIDGRPYVWGGGHASFISKGYDCSGAVSYALHGGGLLSYTQVSGQLASYGDAHTSSGRCEVRADLQRPLAGRTALVVDDVFDTGLSLSEAARLVKDAGAAPARWFRRRATTSPAPERLC